MSDPLEGKKRDQPHVVVVGGGVIGLSVAYHLSKRGGAKVTLLERNSLTSGTSWHAAGIIGPLRASLNLTKLAIYATQLFEALEEETGQATGYRQTGGYWLAQSEDRMTELRRIAAMGEMTGLTTRIVRPEEIAEHLPLLRSDDLAGGLWVAEDGMANPVDLCMAYAKGARMAGAEIREGVSVSQLHQEGGRIRSVMTATGETIACDAAILCCGAWSRQLGATAGLAVPVQAVEHMYVVTEPMPQLPQPFPILRDLEGRIYIKEDAGKLVLGGFETDAKAWDSTSPEGSHPFLTFPEDWDQFEPFMSAGLNRIPAFEETGIQTFMNGPESFTPDTRQLMGEAPNCRGLFLAAGFNSIGIMSSAGVGKVMADWVLDREAPMDLWEVDCLRLEPPSANRAFLQARVEEAVANQFSMHWPFKQMASARGFRRSVLHQAFEAEGAVFGAPTGWERPLWFALNDHERDLPYSYGDQPWWPIAERETKALQDRAALLELSPFAKFELAGRDATTALQRMVGANIDVEAGRLVYGQMLNNRGGIEADVTITRLAEDRYWLVSGAGSRQKDETWLRRQSLAFADLRITDLTTAYSVIGVMGPLSAKLLQAVSPHDFSLEAFAFGSSQEIEIGFARARASRLSFVGEKGWELTVSNDMALHLHQQLCQAGENLGLVHAGHYVIDGCRLEKGYKHWGHDIGPDDTPLEAGLGFAVDFGKPGGFIGLEALEKQKARGLKRRLLLFQVEGAHPLLLHDEPVYCKDRMVGRTTSGARGFRTDLSLAFATITCEPGETLTKLCAKDYEIAVAGERFPLKALKTAPYDPQGRRMRED